MTDYSWKNEQGRQGCINVTSSAGLAVEVDDDHCSGLIDRDTALALAGEIFSTLLASHPPTEQTSEETKKAMWQVLATAPIDFPVLVGNGSYSVIEEALPLCRALRDVTVNAAVRFGFSGIGAMPILLELAVSLGGGKLSREVFLKNAEHWYDSVNLATPNAPALQRGGEA